MSKTDLDREAARRYGAGETLAQIARALGVAVPTARARVVRGGARIRQRGARRVDGSECAYWVGPALGGAKVGVRCSAEMDPELPHSCAAHAAILRELRAG